MVQTKYLLAAALAGTLSLNAVHAADEAPATDLAKGAVDPLDAGGQRARFLRAAGVDSELDETEFNANANSADGFVRSFDKWATLKAFDKNSDSKLDWFEAIAYRESLRKAMLGEYDADKNNRLNDAEREKANAALAAGRLPALGAASRQAAPAAPGAPAAAAFGGAGGPQQFQELRAEMLKKHDKDGDGQLTGDERTAAGEEMRAVFQARFTEQFDTNKDGTVDESERNAAREAGRRQFEQQALERFDANKDGQLDDAERNTIRETMREERRKQFESRFDANGDGEIDATERAAMDAARDEFDQRRKEFERQYDKDGDGQINDEERNAMREALREQFRNGGGQGGFGGRRRGGNNNPQ